MDDNSEKEIKDIKINDKVKLVNLPSEFNTDSNLENFEAEFIGLIVGDGYIDNKNCIRFINSDKKLQNYVYNLWEKICIKHNKTPSFYYYPSKSGFNEENIVGYIDLYPSNIFIKREDLYNEDKTKRIPKIIINSSKENKLAFLSGYNKADGLKSNKCIYTFKNFKTNSAVLACGLIYLLNNTTNQEYNINIETRTDIKNDLEIKRFYYSINVLSDSRFSKRKGEEKEKIVKEHINNGTPLRVISRTTGISRKFIQKIHRGGVAFKEDIKFKEVNNVKKIIEYYDYDGWFYDLETESGTFFCGVGQGLVHNSPRRAHNFVTRKITIGLGKILRNVEDKLVLGNLNAQRDWGHAKDYVRGMWLMLQQDKPDDYILSTNKMYSVREFVEKTFALRGFDIAWRGEGLNEVGYDRKSGRELIFVSEKYFRPAEVEELLGDSTKARTQLGWYPEYSFDDLVREMVDHDAPM